MNFKRVSVRMDRDTGEIWLTEEKYGTPPKRLKNITSDVILALSADIVALEGTKQAFRDVRFSDGTHVRLMIQDLSQGDPDASVFTAGFFAGKEGKDLNDSWVKYAEKRFQLKEKEQEDGTTTQT